MNFLFRQEFFLVDLFLFNFLHHPRNCLFLNFILFLHFLLIIENLKIIYFALHELIMLFSLSEFSHFSNHFSLYTEDFFLKEKMLYLDYLFFKLYYKVLVRQIYLPENNFQQLTIICRLTLFYKDKNYLKLHFLD
jgi:hypothetical protein